MPLIKNASSSSLIRQATVLDLGDLDRQSQRILEQAQEQARQILEEAKRKSQHLIDTAAETGMAQGLEQGMAQGREQGRVEGREQVIAELKPQLEQLVESFTAAMTRWETQRSEMLLAAREDVLAFAVAMGEKIVFRCIEADGSIIEDQLAEALSLLSRPSSLAITINPADRTLVEEVLPELLRTLSDCNHAAIRDDTSVTPGGCIVRTAGGEVDATIETQLDRIVEAILPWTREPIEQETQQP